LASPADFAGPPYDFEHVAQSARLLAIPIARMVS
jgi:hypothetical protein